jgi:hypothetical protein
VCLGHLYLSSMDPTNILFWNVRGYNGSSCQASVRNLVASLRIDVVCLQETKMEVISRVSVLQMLGPDFSNFVFLSLEGWLGFAWKLKDCQLFCVSLVLPCWRDSMVADMCVWTTRQ